MPVLDHSLGWAFATAALVLAAQANFADVPPHSVPHQERETVSDSRLYTELPASEIGVESFRNENSHPRAWTSRWREYLYGTIGTGVAIGDLDGDAKPDIFVASKDEESKLYRNLGNFKFEDITAASGFVDSTYPATGVSFADVDNDGDLDIYLCYVGFGNQLWINDGAARFTERSKAWGVAIQSGSTAASFADFDRDGDLDFYLQNNLVQEGNLGKPLPDFLYENQGERFSDISQSAGISGAGHGHAAIWWDANQDGWPDIYVANDFQANDKLYLNKGDSTFVDRLSSTLPNAPLNSMGADFADINNDGLWDLWASDMAASNRYKRQITIEDLSIAHKAAKPGDAYQYMKNSLQLQVAEGRFIDIADLAGLARTDWTWAPRFIDMDNDGWSDAFVTTGMIRALHDKDMMAVANRIQHPLRTPMAFRNKAELNEANFAFRNEGDLTFSDRGAAWGLDKVGISFGTAFGDLDGDGDLDIVVNNFKQPLSVYRNNESENASITIRLKGTKSNSYGVGARVSIVSGGLRQMRELSLNRGYMSTDQPILHFGLGAEATIDSLEIHWPSGTRQGLKGLETNRHYLIEESSTLAPSQVTPPKPFFEPVELSLPKQAKRAEAYVDEFRSQALLPFRQARRGGRILLGDIDSDGLTDIALSGASGQSPLILKNVDSQKFVDHSPFDMLDDFLSEDSDLHFVDIDKDQDLDLVMGSGGVELPAEDPSYSDRLYLNESGDLQLSFATAFPNTATQAMAFGDYDADGDLDLFSAGGVVHGHYPHTYPSQLWRNEGGTFVKDETSMELDADRLDRATDAQWFDSDNDGDQDLLTIQDWGVPVLWRNENGALERAKAAFEEPLSQGLWTCIAVADLDNDGRKDIIAGNLGLNTEYQASADDPARLWFSSDPNRKKPLIETLVEGGEEWPRREFWRLKKAFKREWAHINTRSKFANAPLPSLFPNLLENGYISVEATELRTGVFWSEPNGAYRFSPLPNLAQSGKVMDILSEDIDGDGLIDLILSIQHEFPDPWSGNIENGTIAFLSNLGNRQFEAHLPSRSGIVLEGSPRGLAWGSLVEGGAPLLFIARSEGFPLIYRYGRSTAD